VQNNNGIIAPAEAGVTYRVLVVTLVNVHAEISTDDHRHSQIIGAATYSAVAMICIAECTEVLLVVVIINFEFLMTVTCNYIVFSDVG